MLFTSKKKKKSEKLGIPELVMGNVLQYLHLNLEFPHLMLYHNHNISYRCL